MSKGLKILVVASAAWLIAIFAAAFVDSTGYSGLKVTEFVPEFAFIGVLPVIIAVGIAWIVHKPKT
jgi:hypothetical protein